MCAARKTANLTNYFSGAKQSQQLSEAQEEIQRLKAEIEELRFKGSTELETQMETLREQLSSQSGILSIPIGEIEPNQEQPRQTFLVESIDSMSRSLVTDGQLQPIILIQRESLVIFDGERRWRSAKALGWQNLQAVIIPEPDSLHRKALLTSLHREDLNPLDKAEAIVRELATNISLEAEEIPRILSTVVRRLNAQKRMNSVAELLTADLEKQQKGLEALELSDYECSVLGLLLDLQLNPASIDANIFPILSLASDLKAAIRGGLKGVHAMVLQKLSAKNLEVTEEEAKSIRVEATLKVMAEKLSVIATRKLVNAMLAAKNAASQTTIDSSVSQESRRLQKMSLADLQKAERTQLVEFQEVLRQKLVQIQELLEH